MKMRIYLTSSGQIIGVNGNYTLEKRKVSRLLYSDTDPSYGYLVRDDFNYPAPSHKHNGSALCQLFKYDKDAIQDRQIVEDTRFESKYTMHTYVSFGDGVNLVKTSFDLVPSITGGEIVTNAIGIRFSSVSIVNENTEIREPRGMQLPSYSRLSVIFEECRQYTRQFL